MGDLVYYLPTQLFNTVSDPEMLAKELLGLAGFRLVNLLGDQFFIEINKFPSSTSFWLKTIVSSHRIAH